MTKPWPHLDSTIVSRGYLLQAMNEMRFAEGGNLPADIAASQLGPASEHIIRMTTGMRSQKAVCGVLPKVKRFCFGPLKTIDIGSRIRYTKSVIQRKCR